MIIELYISGNKIELDEGVPFSYTEQWNNVNDLSDRQTSFTNRFKVPKTPKNIKSFKQLGIVGGKSKVPYTAQSVRLIVDSVTIVINGIARILNYNDDYFDVSVLDGNISLFKALGNKKLKDLDLSDLDHDLTDANFVGSFANTSGFIYGISDFGNFDESKIVINYQLPSFYVHTIWRKIFEQAVFDYDFTPEQDLAITPKRGYDTELDALSEVWDDVADINADSQTVYQTPSPEDVVFKNEIILDLTPDGTHLVNSSVTITEQGNYNVIINASGTYDYATNIQIKVQTTNDVLAVENCTLSSGTYSGLMNRTITCNVGDVIYFTIVANGLWQSTSQTLTVDAVSSGFKFKTTTDVTARVIASTFIGEMTQAQFIKDVMQYYGLVSKKEKDKRFIHFKKMADIINDDPEDWSKYFVKRTDADVNLRNYAKENIFAYNYRQTDDEPFADGIFEIQNDNLKPSKVMVTRPYNACEVSENLLNDNLLTYTPFWQAKRNSDGVITGWRVLKGKNYFAKIIRNNETITYGTQSGADNTYTGDVPRLSFSGLTYQEILDLNYKELNVVLNLYRFDKVTLNFDLIKFIETDPFKPKYIYQLGGKFYVNKIKNSNGKVTAELLFLPKKF